MNDVNIVFWKFNFWYGYELVELGRFGRVG